MEVMNYLKASTLFTGLDDVEMQALANVMSIRRLTKGKIVFLDGDEAKGFYVLFEGKIRIYKSNPEGKEYTIHLIKPNQFFAEVGIFKGGNYPADCMAIENSVAGFFPKDGFLKVIENHPRISLKIISSLSAFLREYNIMVEELALKEVSARLARYILEKTNGRSVKTFIIDITKTELAKDLGTISETLSRNFKKLKDRGIISVNNQEITVHDFDKLELVASGEKI